MPVSILTRRTVLGGMAAATSWLAAPPVLAQKAHPAAIAMRKAARDLLRAQRIGTQAAFAQVIQRYADVPSIAMYSLGNYRSDLPASQRRAYYRGVVGFMSQYFVDQSKKYRVADAQVDPDVQQSGDDFLVRSRVQLASGTTYRATWRLTRTRAGYRISDVKVLGFSLTFLQRGIFSSFLRRRDGDVMALVAALNRI